MSATVGSVRVTLFFESTFSLKDKRGEVKRVTSRISNQFNCAIAEIEDLDDMRVATLGVVVLSTSADHASQMMNTIIDRIEVLLEISTLGEIETELYPF
ncbi:MAG: DUF503 domain-containing protein [Thermomicrobiales bacterium]|nr:DUF503 domain-containing protein [Thermomicrobiales bacterium]MCO5217227.1 DUF503 domain-containing protein [Thermomicrobiales bacterium]MCO5225292.1 DUF503 domain-containing protein [Thermomicrobiales bacterium]MCO5227840.1 DUF503 domain-containing protein [Thermomicrobiales bacterium]